MEEKKSYECNICNITFGHFTAFDRHMRTHSGEKPFSCSICSKSFSLKSNCTRHEATHSSEKPFECDICVKRFKAKECLTKHMRKHSGKNLFTCRICGQRFTQSSHVKNHERSHTGIKEFECPVCNKSFSTDYGLRMHQSVHEKVEMTCNICGKIFTHLGSFKRHIHRHKKVSKKSECPICGKKFSANCYVQTHLLVHTGEKPFECDVCNKLFTRKSTLKEHRFSHEGTKPYQCTECNKSFVWKKLFKDHMEEHVGERYSCNHCDKSYTRKGSFNAHVRMHSEKAVQCIDCLKKFSCLRDLRRHQKVRACLGKPFKCYFCDKVFMKKNSAILHIKKVHAKEDETEDDLHHNNEKLFECRKCEKKFLKEQSRVIHEICVHRVVEELEITKAIKKAKLVDLRKVRIIKKEREKVSLVESSDAHSGTWNVNNDASVHKVSEGLLLGCQTRFKGETFVNSDNQNQIELLNTSLNDGSMDQLHSDETSSNNESKDQFKYLGDYFDESNFRDVNDDDKETEAIYPECNVFIQEINSDNTFCNEERASEMNTLECENDTYGEDILADDSMFEKLVVAKEVDSQKIANCLNRYKKTWECSICSKKFSSGVNLQCHMRIHIGEKPFCCVVCNKSFMRKSSLRLHSLTHKGKKPFRCPECDEAFGCESDLSNHIDVHSDLMYCVKCDKKFPTKSVLTKHLEKHVGESTCCMNCMKTFSSMKSLKVHQKNRTCYKKSFKCSICGEVFIKKVNVFHHVKSIHASCKEAGSMECLSEDFEKSFQCSVCKIYFSNEVSRARHEIMYHKLVEQVDSQDEQVDSQDENQDNSYDMDTISEQKEFISLGIEKNHHSVNIGNTSNIFIKEEAPGYGMPIFVKPSDIKNLEISNELVIKSEKDSCPD